jgi:tetratricopeptide (TPR) repeat protein
LWTREGRPARGDKDARDNEYELTEEERMARELRSVRSRHDDPDLPDDVEPRDLDKGARIELKTLSKENSDWVARHLVMAARLIEDDPEQAHQHAMSAARRAGRIGVVRETLAITAYATGDFALALRELRTYRRISGSNEQLPLMVDSERGVGRADRALELGRSVDRSTLPNDVQVSLAIAMSGARLDLGQSAAALAELEIPQLDPNRAFSWSTDLFHAYADVLDELGRTEQAETWRERAARADEAIGTATSLDEHETVDIVEEEFEVFDVDGEDSVSIGDAGTVDDGEDVVIEIEDDDLLDDETADGEFLDEQFGGDELTEDELTEDELTEDELADDEVASVELENEQLAEETLADEKPESDQPEGGELGRVENARDDEEDGSNDGTVPTDR